MDGFLLDTNIFSIWHDSVLGERHRRVTERIDGLESGSPLWMSIVSLGEIEFGHHCTQPASLERLSEFKAFIRKQNILFKEVTRHTTGQYGRLKAAIFQKYAPKEKRGKKKIIEQLLDPISGHALGAQENDLWIVAQALEHNLVLVSDDRMERIFDVIHDIDPEFRFELDWARTP